MLLDSLKDPIFKILKAKESLVKGIIWKGIFKMMNKISNWSNQMPKTNNLNSNQ